MSASLIAGLGAGAASAAILLIGSHLLPRFAARPDDAGIEHQSFVKPVTNPALLGKAITHREAHLLGILLHLLMSMVVGVAYVFGIDQEWWSLHLLSLMILTVIQTSFLGLVVLPLEGHGIFGRHFDAWMGIDLLITTILWTILYATILSLWSV